jgi:3',5'-cyclic AMP phosphodiesterase CpdA
MTIRIIAMHHHLVGVPDTGTDKIVIVDAGDILRTCLHHDVDLVLCGHKHRPWLWNLETMDIVYAGTASSIRFRGFPKNTYNTLDIKSNCKVSIDLKIVGAKDAHLRTLQGSKKGNLKYDYGYFWQSYADDLKE